jgi:hypothetical protein
LIPFVSFQLSAFSPQLSAFSPQHSALSTPQLAVGSQLSVLITPQLAVGSDTLEVVDQEHPVMLNEVKHLSDSNAKLVRWFASLTMTLSDFTQRLPKSIAHRSSLIAHFAVGFSTTMKYEPDFSRPNSHRSSAIISVTAWCA